MEFEPIYPPGFHDITLDKLEEIFVDPFPENERRAYLTQRFRDYLDKFSDLGLKVEIWVDGSYSTYKPEPGDMDILIIFDANEVNNLSVDKQPVLQELFDRELCKIRYSIACCYALHMKQICAAIGEVGLAYLVMKNQKEYQE